MKLAVYAGTPAYVLIPVAKLPDGVSELDWLAGRCEKARPGEPYAVIDSASLPPDRKFRNAWALNGTAVDVDMPKARVIHMDRIRIERNKELERQDVALRIAEDASDTTEIARVRTERQRLRNIPETFDLELAPNPTALDALWPAGLGRE